MFGFFASQEKKMRENAANWLAVPVRVRAWAVPPTTTLSPLCAVALTVPALLRVKVNGP